MAQCLRKHFSIQVNSFRHHWTFYIVPWCWGFFIRKLDSLDPSFADLFSRALLQELFCKERIVNSKYMYLWVIIKLSLLVTMAGEKRRLGTPPKPGISEISFQWRLITELYLLIVKKQREYLGDLEESLCPGFWGDFSVLKSDVSTHLSVSAFSATGRIQILLTQFPR